MTFTYRYIGSCPSIFTTLEKDGSTWMPNEGDEITLSEAVNHPLLQLLNNNDSQSSTSKGLVPTVVTVPDFTQELTQSETTDIDKGDD